MLRLVQQLLRQLAAKTFIFPVHEPVLLYPTEATGIVPLFLHECEQLCGLPRVTASAVALVPSTSLEGPCLEFTYQGLVDMLTVP